MEALHYAVDKINDDPDILPQVKLGIDLYGLGSCTDKVAQRLMNLTKIASRKTEPIVGIIGPETSDETRYLFNQPAHSMVSIDICFKWGLPASWDKISILFLGSKKPASY